LRVESVEQADFHDERRNCPGVEPIGHAVERVRGVADERHLDLKVARINRVGTLGCAGAIGVQLAEILWRRRMEERESALVHGGPGGVLLFSANPRRNDGQNQQMTQGFRLSGQSIRANLRHKIPIAVLDPDLSPSVRSGVEWNQSPMTASFSPATLPSVATWRGGLRPSL